MKKRKKPKFRRREWHRRRRISQAWRFPKGLHGRPKFLKKYTPAMPKVGYKQPRKVRYLHPSGLQEVLISNPKELAKIDPKRQTVRIASRVGLKKRIEIAKQCLKKGIRILNLRDPESFIQKHEKPKREKVKEKTKEKSKEKKGEKR